MHLTTSLGAAISTIFVVSIADAALITFTHSGTGSGTIAGSRFVAANFTITATADTSNRVSIGGGTFSIGHSVAEINIAGVGTYLFVTATRTFANQSLQMVGFSREPGGSDLFHGPSPVELFATWDMLSSIGPVSGPGRLLQWDSSPFRGIIITNAGQLLFDSQSNVNTTFSAVVVPTPGLAALLTVFVGHSLRRRR